MPMIDGPRRGSMYAATEAPRACPYCQSDESEVITTIWKPALRLVWRYRQCRQCSRRFRTEARDSATR